MKPNPTTNTGRVPSAQTFRLANASKNKSLIQAIAAGLVLLALTLNSMATYCVLTANDGAGTSSFINAANWSPNIAPAPGTTNNTLGFFLRTPTSGALTIFQGDSLTFSNATSNPQFGSVLLKGPNGSMVIITNFILLAGSGIGHGNNTGYAGLLWIGGNMNVQGNAYITDANGAPRYIGFASTITGSGSLSNNCFVIYGGNNTGFTGPLIAGRSVNGGGNGTIIVTNEAAMGGNPASFNAAQLYLNGGTLNPRATFALDYANAGITIGPVGGIFDIASGLALTNSEPLAGSGTLQLTNAGTFVHLGTAASFTGTLAVNNGSFILGTGGSLSGANTLSPASGATFDVSATGLSLASGQTLAGNGTVTGNVTAGTNSKISPAGTGVAATLTVSGDLTLTGSGTLSCDFAATNDVVAVGGNLSASGTTSIQLNNVPNVGSYPLIQVTGTMTGAAGNFSVSALTTRNRSYAVVFDTINKQVVLNVTSSGTAANLIWQGDVVSGLNNVWDIVTTSNWLNGANSDVYYDSDAVNFTDLGATNQPILNVTVNPGAVTFNSSSNYLLSGSGAIAGPTSLAKGGTGTLIVSNINTFSGGTIITNGILRIGLSNAAGVFGIPSGATPLVTVSNTGSLDLFGAQLDAAYTNAIEINGSGVSATQGAIDSSVGGLTSGTPGPGVGTVSLKGDSTVSASANWQIGNPTASPPGLGIIGNGFTLTKIGNSYLYLRRAATSTLGGLNIVGPGGVLFWDRPDAAGLTTPITLTNGGFVDTWNPANNFNGLTFFNPIIVNDPVNGGQIWNGRQPNFNHPGYDIYNGSVTLNGTLTISNTAYLASSTPATFGRVTMNGSISGAGGVFALGRTLPFLGGPVVFYGGNQVIFNGNNSYSGLTTLSNLVVLQTMTANQSGGAYDIEENGTLDVAVAAGKPTLPMSSLVLGPSVSVGPGNVGFMRLTSMPASPVIYATNLTVNGTTSSGFQNGILPPVAGYSVGQFPLIKYEGSIGGNGFDALVLNTPPRGVTASLSNNVANSSIDLVVSTTGIAWRGNTSSAWDIGTANWFNPVSVSSDSYQDGDSVVFDDNAVNYTVNLQQTVSPSGITFDATNDYVLTNVSFSVGAIAGSGALIKNGSGTLTIGATNNSFTGGTYINGGTIKLVDQAFGYPHGAGGLNNNLGNVYVANGGTLDINGIQVPNYQSFGPEGYNVFISGAGVGSNGALVNNSTSNNDVADPGYLTLTGDATVGGAGDVNIRMGVSPQLRSQSDAYTLTKVGAGQFRIRYVTTVSTNFGTINILGGRVSYESSSPLGLGDSSKPIYIGNGGGFGWGTTAAKCVRPLICSNGATIYGMNIPNNVFNSPVTLVGGIANLNANFYNGMIFSNVISGAGGVTVQFQSLAWFAASNTYSGTTTIADCNTSGGTNFGTVLKLIGNGSIEHSANIALQGITASQAFPGALDVTARSDGTLTLVNNQTLRGDNGSFIRGNVVATSGTTIMPGGPTNIQYMSFSNNLTLQSGSAVNMDVSVDSGATNDLIRVIGAMNYGSATLRITNSGVATPTNGTAFKLFSNGSFSGNFATIAGTPGPGFAWIFNPTNGIATAVQTVATNPTNILFSVSGNQLTLSWPSDHLSWILQSQTNSLSQGLSGNWVDVPNSGSSTQAVITIDPNSPTVFFRLRSPP